MSERCVELFRSHDGTTIARVDGRYIYSRYNPMREIERFLRTTLTDHNPDTDAPLLIVSDGLGHLERSARARFPARRILSIHLHGELSRHGTSSADAVCVPEDGCDPAGFVAEHLSPEEINRLDVVEWPPATMAFSQTYRIVAERVAGALRRLVADSATISRWGSLWIRNILRNADRLVFVPSLPSFGDRTVLVVCPGPSLGALLPRLRSLRRRPVLVAVASAELALREWNLCADLVVHSDAGYYSTYHFFGGCNAALCMPLTAAPPPHAKVSGSPQRFRILSGNSHAESVALREVDAVPVIPEAGSVSTTAIRLSCLVSDGPCYVAGLDLASDDLLVHARPHAFDGYLVSCSSRFAPEHHLRFERTADMTRGPDRERHAGNMETYASWFRDNRAGLSRVARLAPTSVDTGLRTTTPDEMTRVLSHENYPEGATGPAGEGHAGDTTSAGVRLGGTRVIERWRSELMVGGHLTDLARELARWLGCEAKPNSIDERLLALRRTNTDVRR